MSLAPVTPEELDAIEADPSCVDSAMVARLVAHIRLAHKHATQMGEMFHDEVTTMQAAWIACEYEGAIAGMEWISNALEGPGLIPCGTWDDDASAWWAAYRSEPFGPCGICARPSTIKGHDYAACSDRHGRALRGTLPDEECRWCREVKPCAYELAHVVDRDRVRSSVECVMDHMRSLNLGRPICADCWPKINPRAEVTT